MKNYTPGEWQADGPYLVAKTPEGPTPDIYLAEEASYDEEGRYEKNSAKRHANMRLMAAAPEMAEALLAVTDQLATLLSGPSRKAIDDVSRVNIDTARAALEKAGL